MVIPFKRDRLLVLSSLLLEVSGFTVILQGRPSDGMLLVLFGMTFCMMMVFADGNTRAEFAHEADNEFARRELMDIFFRPRTAMQFRIGSRTPRSYDRAPE